MILLKNRIDWTLLNCHYISHFVLRVCGRKVRAKRDFSLWDNSLAEAVPTHKIENVLVRTKCDALLKQLKTTTVHTTTTSVLGNVDVKVLAVR